jgi:hypothetical protein
MWLDVFFDSLEQLMDKLRERRPKAMFWTVVVLWSLAAAVPTLGAALTGAGWLSILIPFTPMVVIALTWFRGIARIPSAAWIAALTFWALIPGGLAGIGQKDTTVKTAIAVFLFCYGQLLVALLTAICVRRGYSLHTPFVQLRLTRMRLVAAAFPLAVSFKSDGTLPRSAANWHSIAYLLVTVTALIACAFPSQRKALITAVAIAFGVWAVLAHTDASDRTGQIVENGWLWLSACYQWLRTSRKDFWQRGGPARRLS